MLTPDERQAILERATCFESVIWGNHDVGW
jgi:hypothetical protein